METLEKQLLILNYKGEYMKKILIVIMCFILVGCTNSISLDFNSKVDADVKFSFTASEFIKHQGSEEYAEYNNAEIAEEIEAIINEARPIKDNYDELFEEVKYDSKDDRELTSTVNSC